MIARPKHQRLVLVILALLAVLGYAYLLFVVLLLLGIVAAVLLYARLNWVVLKILWIPLVLAVTLWPLRAMKSLLISLQFHHKAAEGRVVSRNRP